MSETIDNTGRFQKGKTGNPAGRPKGAKGKAAQIKARLNQRDLDDIVKVLAKQAKEGDTQAASLLLARAWPAPKPTGRFLNFAFPTGLGLAGIATAFDAIMAAVGQGHITADEATALSAILERQAKILEVDDTQRRLAAIEAKVVEQQKPRAIEHHG
jgi:uncharacterized protein DUF5681